MQQILISTSNYNHLILATANMSSISSGVDLSVKYHRLSAEYVKIRNQVSVLKAALLDEQSKTANLEQQILERDNQLRIVENENESLTFRNSQLVKRVENLQENLEAQLIPFGPGKGKKKHKEANLRLVAESRMQHHQALAAGGPSSLDPQLVLEEELERKILENSELHSKLFDAERRFDETTNEFLQRISILEAENALLKQSNRDGQNDHRTQSDTTTLASLRSNRVLEHEAIAKLNNLFALSQQDCENNPESSNMVSINNLDKHTKTFSSTDGCSSSKTLVDNTSNEKLYTISQQLNTMTISSRSSDGKPSDSAISLDSVEPSGTECEETAIKRKLLEEYYTDRISALTKSLQHATGRATYYKQECEELIRQSIYKQRETENLRKEIQELEDKYARMNDTLEATQENYKDQMKQLYEHMAGQDVKIAEQTEMLMMRQEGAVSNSSNNHETMTENDQTSNNSGRSWFPLYSK